MAQKKKKQSKPHKNQHKQQTSLKYNLIRKRPDGTFYVQWTMFDATLNTDNYMNAHTPDGVFTSSVYNSLKKMYLKPTASDDGIATYIEKSKKIKTELENRFDFWLKNSIDADTRLNIYSNNSSVDSIDFTEYTKTHDIIRESVEYINQCPDITTLWSVSECFDVFINPNLFYRVYRIGYDNSSYVVKYHIYEYVKFKISDTELITVPTLQFAMVVSPTNITDMKHMTVKNNELISMDNCLKQSIQADAINAAADIVGNKSNFNTVYIGLMGVTGLSNTETHLELHHSNHSKQMYRNLRDRLRELCIDIYRPDKFPYETDEYSHYKHRHVMIAPTIILAAIIVANKYLKDNKLSKPKQTAITHNETEIILENKPMRKTRILGDNIKITSEKRPQYQTFERIIKYHTPEWTHKGYLRKLKSGKIIEIKPGVCKRRCVDMKNIKSNLKPTVTDYIIKPNNDDNTDTKSDDTT